MPIGEFAGAPLCAEGRSRPLTTPTVWMYEMAQASLNPPSRYRRDQNSVSESANPLSHTEFGISIAAGCELFERTTRLTANPNGA